LAQELSDFKRWAIKSPRVHTDHRAIIAEMTTDRFYIHKRYTTCRRQLPDFPLQYPLSENDVRFQHLKKYKNEIEELPKQREKSWISRQTWKLIDKRVYAVRRQMSDDLIHDYGKEIRKSLRMDRRQRAYRISMQIEQKMTAGNMKGAYDLLRGWYRDCGGGKPPRPTRKDLDMIRRDFKALFQKEAPPEEPLPIHVQPASISDTVPNEDSILLAVK
jgi:hypothetical protein